MKMSIPRDSSPRWSSTWVVAAFLILIVATLAIFRPATTGPFVFDDFPNLGNLRQLDGHVDRSSLGQYLTAFTGSPGRPLAALSFIIEDSSWPTDPEPYKRNNVLWHLLCGVLVFVLSRQLANTRSRTALWADAIGILTMAAWSLHPMQLSATMLVVQRMNILCSIAVLAGLIGYIKIVGGANERGLRHVIGAGGILGFAGIIAFLCKENGVLIFAYASVLNLTVLRPNLQRLMPRDRRLLLAGCAAPIAALATAALVEHDRIVRSYANRDFTLTERLLTEPRILLEYLHNILLPRIGGQGIFHDNYPISHTLLSPPTTTVAIVAIVVTLGLAWRLRTRLPVFSLAIGWYFAGHLIESTVWPLELYFEHRNYLPMLAPLYAVVAATLCTPKPYEKLARLLLAAWLLLAASLTAINAPVWGRRGALASVWFRENPHSVRAIQMMASYQTDRGDYVGARNTLLEGLERVPRANELAMQVTLLDCYVRGVTPDQYRGTIALARQVRFTHLLPELAARFGSESRGNRCHGTLPADGFRQFAAALLENPAVRRNGRATAYIYIELSKQAVKDRDLDATMRYLDAAYDANKNPLVARNQAIYLLTAGLPDDAMKYLRKSETAPRNLFDRWLLDVPELNRNLWASAIQMKRTLENMDARAGQGLEPQRSMQQKAARRP